MSVVYGMTLSGKKDFLMGVHQTGDAYMVALYDVNADLNQYTETYVREHEVRGQGYMPGGKLLTGYDVCISGARACMSWDPIVLWPNATLRARHALIYNKSKGNRAITILDLGEEVSSTNGPWELKLPDPVIWIG